MVMVFISIPMAQFIKVNSSNPNSTGMEPSPMWIKE